MAVAADGSQLMGFELPSCFASLATFSSEFEVHLAADVHSKSLSDGQDYLWWPGAQPAGFAVCVRGQAAGKLMLIRRNQNIC